MPDAASSGVTVRLEGSHLRVDARPARLVSLLKGADGGSRVSAHPASGTAHDEPLPKAARQATFQLRDDVAVEATSAAAFVAIAEETGRCLVIAYEGEVTVVPGGERFALSGDEALVFGTGGDPEVVPVSDLTAERHPQLAALLDGVADAVLGGGVADTEPEPDAKRETKPEPAPVTAASGVATAGGAAAAEKTAETASEPAAASTARAAGPQSQRRKKGKKGRPQPAKSTPAKSPGKAAPAKAAPAKKAGAGAGATGGAAAAGAGAPGGAKAAGASKAAKAGGGGQPPRKVPPETGGGGGGGHDDEPYEDTPRDKRFLIGAVLVALLLAVGAVLILSNTDGTEVATDTPDDTATTSEAPATTEPAAVTTAAPATTAAPTTEASTTTARPATTTTAAAPAPDYSIEPKSCVQNGNSITYTAAVTNKASAPFDFTVSVSFKTSDGSEVATGTATVTRLASGRTADFSATGTSSRNLAGTGASCDVTRVDARASR